MSLGRPLSRRQSRPRFKRGTTVEGRIRELLKENGVELGAFRVERLSRGSIYMILVGDRAVGEYNHLHHRVHFYDTVED